MRGSKVVSQNLNLKATHTSTYLYFNLLSRDQKRDGEERRKYEVFKYEKEKGPGWGKDPTPGPL